MKKGIDPFKRRIHHTFKINSLKFFNSIHFFRRIGRFIVDGARRIQLFYSFNSLLKAVSKAAFIAKRPYYNTGTVDITGDESFQTIYNGKFPIGIIRKLCIAIYIIFRSCVDLAMCFNVAFVNYIKTILVAKLIKFRTIWVMGRTDCVYIVLFHHFHVMANLFNRCDISSVSVTIVAIYAFKFNFFAVKPYDFIFYADFPNPDAVQNAFVRSPQDKTI